jgi:hypothetical protein
MGDEKPKQNLLWQEVSTSAGARAAANHGVGAAGIVAAVTLGATLLSMSGTAVLGLNAWAFLDVGLFAAVAFGIWRMSRTAAVLGLGLYLFEQVYQLVVAGPLNPIMAMFFTLFFVHGVRGTFAFHRLAEQAQTAPPEAPPA